MGVREERKPCSALSTEFGLCCSEEWRACFKYLRGSLLPLLFLLSRLFIFFIAPAISASSPKPWFYIADLFLPMASVTLNVILETWFLRCDIMSSPVSGRALVCCSPSSSCHGFYMFYISTSPRAFPLHLLLGVVERGSICKAAPLNLEQNCLLQTLETLYDHNRSHDEKVANSDLVCNHFQMLILSGKLLSYKLVHVDKSFLMNPSLYRWFANIYASCTNSWRLMGGIYSLTTYTCVW